MSLLFRTLGAAVLSMCAFVGVFVIGFTITQGSIWMLAFFPLCLIAMALPLILLIALPELRKEDR